MNHPALASGVAGRMSFSNKTKQFPPLFKCVWFAYLKMFLVRHTQVKQALLQVLETLEACFGACKENQML